MRKTLVATQLNALGVITLVALGLIVFTSSYSDRLEYRLHKLAVDRLEIHVQMLI